MTVKQAIEETDQLLPNHYSTDQKLLWLSELDGLIKSEILAPLHHTSPEKVTYTADDTEKELIVPEPYTGIYRSWLEMQIHRANMETEHYNAASTLFTSAYMTFAESCVRSCEAACPVKYFMI